MGIYVRVADCHRTYMYSCLRVELPPAMPSNEHHLPLLFPLQPVSSAIHHNIRCFTVAARHGGPRVRGGVEEVCRPWARGPLLSALPACEKQAVAHDAYEAVARYFGNWKTQP